MAPPGTHPVPVAAPHYPSWARRPPGSLGFVNSPAHDPFDFLHGPLRVGTVLQLEHHPLLQPAIVPDPEVPAECLAL